MMHCVQNTFAEPLLQGNRKASVAKVINSCFGEFTVTLQANLAIIADECAGWFGGVSSLCAS